jgi:hypothetical protein
MWGNNIKKLLINFLTITGQNLKSIETAFDVSPTEILNGYYPKLLDEYQMVPSIWRKIGMRADELEGNGLYILDCCSSVLMNQLSHSGVLRIQRAFMCPFSCFENNISIGFVSIKNVISEHHLD